MAEAGEWTTGLCDCSNGNIQESCMTCFCPCVTFGRNAEIIDQGTTVILRRTSNPPADDIPRFFRNYLGCFSAAVVYTALWISGYPACYSCIFRAKLRGLYSLPAEPCGDFWVHLCCAKRALSQEHRELVNRGFDPTLGWAAQVQPHAVELAATEPPATISGMDRQS